jgi:uncharacterized protein involved in exopolysaccharide biosynthesis
MEFTASASFIAQGSSASTLPSALQGLAASVGLTNTKDYSPQFYADLVTSRPVLAAALNRKYTVPNGNGGPSRTYFEIEHFTGADSAVRLDNGLRHLQRRVASRADVRTNIVTLSVTARYPTLSRELAGALLEALDSMNISFRQEQSRELREFFETRVANAQRELDSAEAVLRDFLERNRATQNSPLLQFEQMRLTRTADLKRTVYTTVVEQYEGAKLQEARNVPVLTILMPPTVPTRKSGPPRRFIVVLGVIGGLLVALAWEELGTLKARFGSRAN